MAMLFLSIPAELLTNAGEQHVVPAEVMEQAEPNEEFETALRYALKAGLIMKREYDESSNRVCAA